MGKGEGVTECHDTRIPLIASGIPDFPIQLGNVIGHIKSKA